MTKPRSGRLSLVPASAIFDHRLSPADVRVLAALGTYAGKDGRCWPAANTLAQKIGLSERHVRRCLQSLSDHGFVEIEKRFGQSNIYQIPRTWVSGVEGVTPDMGVRYPGHGCQVPRTFATTPIRKNDTKNDSNNDYAFAGKILRLTRADFDAWETAYQHLDLRAQIQALDDWYDRHLTGKDRSNAFYRCSQALAKKNEHAKTERAGAQEGPKFNDGVY